MDFLFCFLFCLNCAFHHHFVAFPFVSSRTILAVLKSAFYIITCTLVYPLFIVLLLVYVAQQPKPLDIEGLRILQANTTSFLGHRRNTELCIASLICMSKG